MNGHRFGIARGVGLEAGGFLLRLLELAHEQRRSHDADAGAHLQGRIVGLRGTPERGARLVEPRFLEEQRSELELQLGVARSVAAFDRQPDGGTHQRDQPTANDHPHTGLPSDKRQLVTGMLMRALALAHAVEPGTRAARPGTLRERLVYF